MTLQDGITFTLSGGASAKGVVRESEVSDPPARTPNEYPGRRVPPYPSHCWLSPVNATGDGSGGRLGTLSPSRAAATPKIEDEGTAKGTAWRVTRCPSAGV